MAQLPCTFDAAFEEVQRCTGPLPDGSCRRVTQGEMLPCAGLALAARRSAPGAQAYEFSGRATRCPMSLAVAAAVDSDAPFGLAGWRPERDARGSGRPFRRDAADPHRHAVTIARDAS